MKVLFHARNRNFVNIFLTSHVSQGWLKKNLVAHIFTIKRFYKIIQ